MPTIEIIGDEAIELDFKDKPTQVQKALVRALNRSIKSGRTVMVREMASNAGVKQKDIRDAIALREATISTPEARISTTMKRIPLIKFGAKGPYPSRGKGRGVTYRLASGRGRIETAFIARMPGGHEGVFKRKGKARLGITELYGPSFGQVFSKFRKMALDRAYEVFQKEFDHELKFATSGAGNDAD